MEEDIGYPIQVSTAGQPLAFFLTATSDHITGLIGKAASVVVKIRKAGGSAVTPSGAITEIDATNMPGWYQVAGNATDSNTLGPMLLHAADAASDPYDDLFPVVAYNPLAATNLGLSALPTASPAAAGGLPTFGTGTGQVNPSGGKVPATLAAGDLATDSITAAAVKADAVAKVQVGLASQASVDDIPTAADNLAAINADAGFIALKAVGAALDTMIETADLGVTYAFTADALAEAPSGGAAPSAADIWTYGARVLTAGTNIVLAKGVGVTGFTDLSAAAVNAEVLDVLTVDTFAEPAAVPAATATLEDKIGWVAALARNSLITTEDAITLRNAVDTADIAAAAHAEDVGTYTRDAWE